MALFSKAPAAAPVADDSGGDETGLSLRQMAARLNAEGDGGALSAPWLPVVFACLRLITTRLQSLPVRVLDADGSPGRAPPWLERPSPMWSWEDLVAQSVWSLVMAGNLYIWPMRGPLGRVAGVGVAPPDSVSVVKRNAGRAAATTFPDVTYRVAGKRVDLLHVRWLALPGAVRGVGAAGPLSKPAMIGKMSEEVVFRHFGQGAKLQTVFSSREELGREALVEATRRIRATMTGLENAWKPIVLSGAWDVETVNQTAEQAEYLPLMTANDARIASQVFGVDPTLVGVVQQGASLTYTNAVDRERNLWLDALRPVAAVIERAFGSLLGAGRRLDFDESKLLTGSPKDKIAFARGMAAANKAAGAWVFTADEVRAAAGYVPLGGDPEPLAAPTMPAMEPEG